MSRYTAPSPFGQPGTSDPRKIGFGYSSELPSAFGPHEWSRRAARRAVRISGQNVAMTPQRLIEVLALLGWSVSYAASTFGVDRRTIRDWRGGYADVPPPVAQFLEAIIASPAFAEWQAENSN